MLVITHHEMGIYLGNSLGLGFWSRLDAVGQDAAVLFGSEDDARTHVRSWESHNDPDAYRYVQAGDDLNGYASVASLERAGLAHMIGGMIRELREPMTDFDEKARRAAEFYWQNNGIFNRFEGVPETLVHRMAFVYGAVRIALQSPNKDIPPPEMAARAFIHLGGGDPNSLHGETKTPLWRWAASGVARALEAGWPELLDSAAWTGSETAVEYLIERDVDADVHTVAAYGSKGPPRIIGPFTVTEAERFVAAMQ